MTTLLFVFPNFYIINLPTIIAIQFLDAVGENIVILYKLACIPDYWIGTQMKMHITPFAP